MSELSIKTTHLRLKNKLKDYIIAQYFANNSLLLEVVDKLLDNQSIIAQEPYIEVGKNYKTVPNGFKNADISSIIKEYLEYLRINNLGVFNEPFVHQVKAVENFYKDKDLLITTGTGSGKTECFLWNMFTKLIYEANNSKSWQFEGIRFLMLYPMNALVSDQLTRIRQVVGNDKFNNIISPNRRVRFGMYTGRTDYHGKNDPKKDYTLANLIRKTYLSNNTYTDELKKINRIPSKDLESFCNNLKLGYQKTGSNDAELFTRYEMQSICPDILITNYSMLEYMLMRPIEQVIWKKTKNWLESSKDNKLTIILDEAHMYKGSAGGEVSLLIRRLLNKLNITRDKVQFILTTASMPKNKENDINKFICSISCQSYDKNNFVIIKEEYNELSNNSKGTPTDLNILTSIDYDKLYSLNINDKLSQLNKLAQSYNWDNNFNEDNLYSWLYDKLIDYPPMQELIKNFGGKGTAFSTISRAIFPNKDIILSERAMETLLALGTLAKSNERKVLIPSKLHLFFRGLDGIFTCLNPRCKKSISKDGITLGFIDEHLHFQCPYCNSRMFELINDRRCGTLFVKAFVSNNNEYPKILWQEKSSISYDINEVNLWIVPDNYIIKYSKRRKKNENMIGYLNFKTGNLFNDDKYMNNSDCIRVLIPYNNTFSTCPNCERSKTRLTPFKTLGNEPFSNLITEQFQAQPKLDDTLKNEGKKVLLFSDSRQKASTLAKDITIISDTNASKQVLFYAIKELEKIHGKGNVKLDYLYTAFLYIITKNNLNFYYGNEKDNFLEDIHKFAKYLETKQKRNRRLTFTDFPVDEIPELFYQYVLKNISDNYHAFQNLCLAELVLLNIYDESNEWLSDIIYNLQDKTNMEESNLLDILNSLIQYYSVNDIAIFPTLHDDVRASILPFERGGFGLEMNKDGCIKLPTHIEKVLKEHCTTEQINSIRETFGMFLSVSKSNETTHNRKYLSPKYLTIRTNEGSIWYHCNKCCGNSTYKLYDSCIHCGSKKDLIMLDDKTLSRYDFWRKPILNISETEIKNLTIEEHTAQLSHNNKEKDNIWATTEEYEMRFRNININDKEPPIDILSCTTTMEVGIDIGSLVAVGLRNVPPMRENYQQRAGRAGRKGSAISTIVTYTENGPHDAWYYKNPSLIISGEPRTPWIDVNNDILIKRHINMILLQEYCLKTGKDIDGIIITELSDENLNSPLYYKKFLSWISNQLPFDMKKTDILIPDSYSFNYITYLDYIKNSISILVNDIQDNPEKYDKYIEDNSSKLNKKYLIDVFFTNGFLPTYSFPRNIVNFWIEDRYGRVIQSPERSLDIALSEYAPGKIVVVNKKSYISGGLYNHYTKFKYRDKQAQFWLNMKEYKKIVYYCENPLCNWFGIDNFNNKCPLCNKQLSKQQMIKPWGFTARDGIEIPETRQVFEYSNVEKPSYSTFPKDLSNMIEINSKLRIEQRSEQELTLLNRGSNCKGFYLCNKCGAIEPVYMFDFNNEKDRKRPYVLPYIKNDPKKCNHERELTFLGYNFKTDMLVLELTLDRKILNTNGKDISIWLIPAITTFTETLALASSMVLDIDFTEIKSGYRLRNKDNTLYADIYLYDNLSSGAGYACKVKDVINEIFDEMKNILSSCNCDTSCPKCIRNFWNSNISSYLDRNCGLELLNYIYYNEIKTTISNNEIKKYLESLQKIFNLSFYDIEVSNNKVTLNGISKDLIIYPAMLSENFIKNRYNNQIAIYVPDRICKIAPEKILEIPNLKEILTY